MEGNDLSRTPPLMRDTAREEATVRRFGKVLFLFAGPLIILSLLLISPEILSEGPACQRAQQWVLSRAGDIPRTLDRIGAFPAPYIKAILAALPAETRCALWKQHLDRVAKQHPEFSRGQKSAVQYFINMLSPEIFSTSRDDIHWGLKVGAPLASLEERLNEAFPNQTERRLLDLGSGYHSYLYLPAIRVQLSERVRNVFVVSADEGGECICTTDGACTAHSGGKCDVTKCDWTEDGCGPPPYVQPCTKKCSYPGADGK